MLYITTTDQHANLYQGYCLQIIMSLLLRGILIGTCPKGQAQHCLVHGIFKTEVWNDLEVVGGMKCIGCNRRKKKKIKERISGLIFGCLQTSYRTCVACPKVNLLCLQFSYRYLNVSHYQNIYWPFCSRMTETTSGWLWAMAMWSGVCIATPRVSSGRAFWVWRLGLAPCWRSSAVRLARPQRHAVWSGLSPLKKVRRLMQF